MKVSLKDFLGKCDQILFFMQIYSNSPKKKPYEKLYF